MERMTNLICPNCGGSLEPIGGALYKCRSCGGERFMLSDEVNILCTGAFDHLRRGEFDDAEEKFDSVIAMHPDNAEAYWGRALTRQGVVFVDDSATRRRVPTCANISEERFIDDPDYLRALRLAPFEVAESYRRLGGEIENVRREWFEKARREKPYDIFICYKESDSSGFRTPDSYEAQALYTHFVQAGYNVFFARESLRNKVGEHYEPYIYNALRTAKVMILYGQKSDNLKSVWVRNEWSRYLGLIDRGLKHSASLIVAYERMLPSDLPQRLRVLQCMDASRKTFLQDLDAHVSDVMLAATPLVGTVDRIDPGHSDRVGIAPSEVRFKKIGTGGSATVVMDGERKERVIKKLLESGMYGKAARMVNEELAKTPNAGKILYYKLLCDCLVKNDYEFTTMRAFKHSGVIERIIDDTDKRFAEKLLVNCYLLAANLMTTSPRDGAALAATVFPYDFPERGKCVRKLMKAIANVRGGAVFTNILNSLADAEYGADTLAELGDACLTVKNFRYAQECFTLSAKRFGRADAYRGILRAKTGRTLSCRKVEYESGAGLLAYAADFENVLRALSGRPFALEVRSALDSVIADSEDVGRMVKAFNHFIKYYLGDIAEIADLFRLASDKCLLAGRFKDVIYYQSVLLGINDKDPSCYWNIILAKTSSRNVEELLNSKSYIDKLDEYDKFLAVASESDVDKCIALSRRQREGCADSGKKGGGKHVRRKNNESITPSCTAAAKTKAAQESGASRFIAPYILVGIAFLISIGSIGSIDSNPPPFFIAAGVLLIVGFSLTVSEIRRNGYSHAAIPIFIVGGITGAVLVCAIVLFIISVVRYFL